MEHRTGLDQPRPHRKSVSKLFLLLFTLVVPLFAREGGSSSGAAIFKGKCVLCHGTDGSGTDLGKQLRAADLRSKKIQGQSNAELHQVLHDGRANMPAFADQLSDEEISQVIQYVRNLGYPRRPHSRPH